MSLSWYKKDIIKWVIYFFLLMLFYSLQTAPFLFSINLFSINEIRPILLLPLVIAVAMFEKPMPSAVYGMIAGLLWDTSAEKLLGFNGLIFLLMALAVSLFSVAYIRTKLVNYLWIFSILMIIHSGIDFLFYYFIWNIENKHIIYINHYLPTTIYTIAISLIFFLVIKVIAKNFNEIVRN